MCVCVFCKWININVKRTSPTPLECALLLGFLEGTKTEPSLCLLGNTQIKTCDLCLSAFFQLCHFSYARVMFSKATANFVHQIDPEGSLIHVSRVNDSKKLVPMALVVKRNRPLFWQKPKYHPTDFTLSNLLQGDEVLHPGT